jgi:Phosphoribosyl transferase (PRTase)/Phosphoribosyl transferase/TRSP domain C terminus to PRTase_2/PELOTA RNA binding domain
VTASETVSQPWSGRWVADALGVTIRTGPDSTLTVPELVGMALRRNPRRAHLLVSTVLGKHLPADPRLVYSAGRLLGAMLADRLAGTNSSIATAGGTLLRSALQAAEPAADTQRLLAMCREHLHASQPVAGLLVLGYAETATALGHCVAESVRADYLHSTRRPVAGIEAVAGFDEEHSHAPGHLLLPAEPALLAGTGPLVLVDDELSTGKTALNTIRALHRNWPRQRYLIAALVDLRSPADRARLRDTARVLGVEIEVVALASAELRLAENALAVGQRLAARAELQHPIGNRARLHPVLTGWPAGLPEGGRHGFEPGMQPAFERAAAGLARELAARFHQQYLGSARRILVLGCEELMYAPLRIATELAGELDGRAAVHFSCTTRSPVVAVDDPGYAIRNRLSFASAEDPADASQRYAYNVAGLTQRYTDIVLITDRDLAGQHGPDGLIGQLASVTDHLHPVRLPVHRPASDAVSRRASDLPAPLTGPDFGSYPAADVAWLLTDLSGVALEAPTEEREEAIQSGGAHYAESLPQEYQPSAEYRQLFTDALAESAQRLAHAVGVVTELALDQRGAGVVLASLARAGTPVGVLMRRWAQFAHRAQLPHYSVSIVRGRGIDEVALAYLAEHHNPADVLFVDGWTGKGAITRELAAAVAAINEARGWSSGRGFSPELAVLADPGGCAHLYGTREDYLIPSACLNATVSGLVSRTVLNSQLIGPGEFHGAKFYAELAEADVSAQFLDAVTAEFANVSESVARDWPALRDCDRRPTWAGWRAVQQLSDQYGIGDVNLIKPGLGETTRVLLRRVPWRVLIRAGEADRLRHLLLLADQRGVPVESVTGLAFSCVGLIHPRFSRGAVGATGEAVGR